MPPNFTHYKGECLQEGGLTRPGEMKGWWETLVQGHKTTGSLGQQGKLQIYAALLTCVCIGWIERGSGSAYALNYNSKQGRGGDKCTKINAASDALIAHARLPPAAKTVPSSGQIIAPLMNCCRIRSFHRPANSVRLCALNANASTNI